MGYIGNNSMSFGTPSRNGLNDTERIPYDRPAYSVAGETESNKKPVTGRMQIDGNDGMMSNNLRVLKEADVDIQTEETGQKKDQSLKTDLESRMAEKFANMKKVCTYSSICCILLLRYIPYLTMIRLSFENT